MQVISYGDLLWRSHKVIVQLDALLPCIKAQGYDSNFKPQRNRDIFLGNKLKITGSILEYGKSHPPPAFHYDDAQGVCTGTAFDYVHDIELSFQKVNHTAFEADPTWGQADGPLAKLLLEYQEVEAKLLKFAE